MSDTLFLFALAAWLGMATVLLFRNPTHGVGFLLFILLYPLFLLAWFFVSSGTLVLAWLALAIANMPLQYLTMKRAGMATGIASTLLASVVLWPVQFAAVINSSQTAKSESQSRAENRAKLGPLPASVQGTVSYTHHHGTETGHDSVWLEEYGDLGFVTDSKTFDRIGIAEGKSVTLVVDEHADLSELGADDELWITDGRVADA